MTTALTTTQHDDYGIAMLDVYAGGEVVEPERIEAIATISAGSKEPGKAHPTRSMNGTIVLHDSNNRAPGLKAALEATKYKSLTIAFPMDDPRLFVQQRFTRYSATALEVYGDTNAITEIQGKTRIVYQSGTKGYNELVKTCKVSVSVYFALASMIDGMPAVEFPDGFGCYRLRFTSRNSLRSLNSAIVSVQRATQGRIAGIPFELSIDYRDATDPDGQRRTVPVWTFLPFKGMRLTSDTFRKLTSQAITAGSALLLPAPAAETIEYAVADMPVDDEALDQLQHGGQCDATHYCKAFFAAVKGTDFDNEAGRAQLVAFWTSQATSSLKEYLSSATEADAAKFVAWVREWSRAAAIETEPEAVTHTTTVVEATGEIVATVADSESEYADLPDDDDAAEPAIEPDVVSYLREQIRLLVAGKSDIPEYQANDETLAKTAQSRIKAMADNKSAAIAEAIIGHPLPRWSALTRPEATVLCWWFSEANRDNAAKSVASIAKYLGQP